MWTIIFLFTYYNININSNVSKSRAVEDLQVVNYMKESAQDDYFEHRMHAHIPQALICLSVRHYQ